MRAARSPPEAHKGGVSWKITEVFLFVPDWVVSCVCGPVADGPRAGVGLGRVPAHGALPTRSGAELQGRFLSPAPPSCIHISCGAQTAAQTHTLLERSQCWLSRFKSRAMPGASPIPVGMCGGGGNHTLL